MNKSWTYSLLLFAALASVVFALSYVGTKLYFQKSSVSTSKPADTEQTDESPIVGQDFSQRVDMTRIHMREGQIVYRVAGTRVGDVALLGAAVRTEFTLDGDTSARRYAIDFFPDPNHGVYPITYFASREGGLDDVEGADANRLRSVLSSAKSMELRIVYDPKEKSEQSQNQKNVLDKLFDGEFPGQSFVFLPLGLGLAGPRP